VTRSRAPAAARAARPATRHATNLPEYHAFWSNAPLVASALRDR
jgi:hypothetical protein